MPTGTGKTILAAALILAIWYYYKSRGVRRKQLVAIFSTPRKVVELQAYSQFKSIVTNASRRCIRAFNPPEPTAGKQ